MGDKVTHWTEVASVGTTGHSTGNHLHYQVENSNREKNRWYEVYRFYYAKS